jgi:hypothetical protein
MYIHFVSGKVQEVEGGTDRLDKFIVELKSRGMKLMRDVNEERVLIIPLTSNTIEYIEHKIEPKPEVVEPVEEPVSEMDELEKLKAELAASKKEMDAKKDIEEKRKEAEELFQAKADCTHQNKSIWKKVTSSGTRYVPICDFCGKREKYVKAASLDEDVKASARVMED